MKLPNPKTTTQEVLHHLIEFGKVSIFDFPYLSGFRTRISNLKIIHGINLETDTKTAENKYKRTFSFAVHTLPESELENAIKVYLQINEQNKI